MPMGMYLPKPLKIIFAPIFKNIYGKSKEEIAEFPSVWGANMITLCDDMLTVKTDAVRIIPEKTKGTSFEGHGFFEGSSIRKIKDTYYFIYSSQKNHELCYATSKYPDRDFTYGGTIVSNGDVVYNGRKEKDRLNATGTAHGSIENINGQWYVFYHRLTHGSDYSRQACAEPIQIESDGSIHQVEISSCGLNGEPLKAEGNYPSVIACNITNGKMPHLSNQKSKKIIPMVTHKGNERFISNIDIKTTITYKWFDFIMADGEISFDIDSGAQGEMIVTADDEVIARVPINNFGRTTVSAKYHIQDLRRKSLSFRFSGKGRFDLYSFTFQ